MLCWVRGNELYGLQISIYRLYCAIVYEVWGSSTDVCKDL
jgi:hypothetical protein